MYLESNIFQNDSEESTVVQNSSQILAHYKIELQKQKKKLRQKVQSCQQQIADLQIQIRNSYKNIQSKTQDTYLKNELDFKKAQIQNLKIVLLKITDKKSYNSLNTIDQALIIQQTPEQIIKQKQRNIKQLSQELAIAQQKFQGKYFIQHKAMNEFEVQMHQNKKLKAYVLQNQRERQFYEKSQTKKSKTIAATAFYNKQYQNQQKRYHQLSQMLKKIQLQGNKQSKKQGNFNQTQLRYLQTIQSQYLKLNNELEKQIESLQKQIHLNQRAYNKEKEMTNEKEFNEYEKTKQKQRIQTKQKQTIMKDTRKINRQSNDNLNQEKLFKEETQSELSESDADSISNTSPKLKLNWNLGIRQQVNQNYNIKSEQKMKVNNQDKQKYKQFGLDQIYNHKRT